MRGDQIEGTIVRLGITTLYGAVAGLALVLRVSQGLAAEPGNFQQNLPGVTIDLPLAVAPPPGVYGSMHSVIAPNLVGTGQNLGSTASGVIWAAGLEWSTGYHFLGAALSMAVVQPFDYLAAHPTNGESLAGNVSGPPFGDTTLFLDIHNTLFTPISASWKLGNGWFGSLSFAFFAPDGSRYNGTTNPDYWTYEPRAAIAYLGKDWRLTANFKYDFNTPSEGHTGLYQIVSHSIPIPALASTVASIGDGYTTGQEAFLDLAATYQFRKWTLGPVGSLKWQTTADSPGGGFNCSRVTALLGPTLTCGNAANYSVGGLVGYDFGPVEIYAWATDSVYSRDDFGGWVVYTRLLFKIWGLN